MRKFLVVLLVLMSTYFISAQSFTFPEIQGKWHFTLAKDAVPSIITFQNENTCQIVRFGSEPATYNYKVFTMEKITYIQIGDFIYTMSKGYAKNSIQLTPNFEGLGILLIRAR